MYEQLKPIILARLANGESLRQICKTEGMPHESTVRFWTLDDAEFATQYARARSSGLDSIAEEIQEIADETSGDSGENANAVVQRARVRIDARKWLLSKMRPDKYGDRTVLAGDAAAPLEMRLTRVE